MNRFNIIFAVLFILSCSCNKQIDKDALTFEIESFSRLKINPNSIDSISYKYDIAYRDDVVTYVIYMSDARLRELFLEPQKIADFELYAPMDSLSSFSKNEGNCLRQVNINFPKNGLYMVLVVIK